MNILDFLSIKRITLQLVYHEIIESVCEMKINQVVKQYTASHHGEFPSTSWSIMLAASVHFGTTPNKHKLYGTQY